MARITLDFHDDRADAASALVSLRAVGLNAGDIASIWTKGPEGTEAAAQDDTPIAFSEVELHGLGPVRLSGWFAQAALEALADRTPLDLARIMTLAGVEAGDVDRVGALLTRGGGVTAVRARDALQA